MIEPIVDDVSHKKALERIEALWDAQADTPEGAELDALATLVDAYERKAFPILPPDPVSAMTFRCSSSTTRPRTSRGHSPVPGRARRPSRSRLIWSSLKREQRR